MKKLFVVLMIPVLFFDCNDDDSSVNLDCSEIACTEIFISHYVTVKDPSGVAVPLDDFSVTDADSGEDITRALSDEEFEEARRAGTYPLYDDLTDASRAPFNRTIVFKGFISNEEVVSEIYSAGIDCCHSSVGKGSLNLILQ